MLLKYFMSVHALALLMCRCALCSPVKLDGQGVAARRVPPIEFNILGFSSATPSAAPENLKLVTFKILRPDPCAQAHIGAVDLQVLAGEAGQRCRRREGRARRNLALGGVTPAAQLQNKAQ